MKDDLGCPIPCPECGNKWIRLIPGRRVLEHYPGCSEYFKDNAEIRDLIAEGDGDAD